MYEMVKSSNPANPVAAKAVLSAFAIKIRPEELTVMHPEPRTELSMILANAFGALLTGLK